MTPDLPKTLATAEVIARQAGAILREAVGKPRQIEYKGVIDLVTQYDKQVEAHIGSSLRAAFPDHLIIGEEGTGADLQTAGHYTWIIDPIDGTTNFAHGMPNFCTSIGLADPDGKPLLGVIYDPCRDECYTAWRGGGAYLNHQRLQVSNIRDVAHALVISEFPYSKWTDPDNNADEWAQMLLRTQQSISSGAAALDLCYVAAGRVDAFWVQGCKAWDVCAGIVLVEEAGGRISNYRGTLDGVYAGTRIVATNGHIHERILTILMMGPMAPRPNSR
jgi:myo-inositol-1(or 4)-monophosphatase